MSLIFIYVTYPSHKEAEKIISHLVQKKLIACATLLPVKSIYHLKGKVKKSNEVISLMKTTAEKWDKIKQEVTKLHSYKIPCIIKLPADANLEYLSWVAKCVQWPI